MDILVYALARKFTKKAIKAAIDDLGTGFRPRGEVNTVDDLPSSASAGDLYIVKNPGCKAAWLTGKWVIFDKMPKNVSELNNDAHYVNETQLENAAAKLKAGITATRPVGGIHIGDAFPIGTSIETIVRKMLTAGEVDKPVYCGLADAANPTSIEGLQRFDLDKDDLVINGFECHMQSDTAKYNVLLIPNDKGYDLSKDLDGEYYILTPGISPGHWWQSTLDLPKLPSLALENYSAFAFGPISDPEGFTFKYTFMPINVTNKKKKERRK